MKFVFVGNSGSGKTTLAERIALEVGEAMHYTNLRELKMPMMTDDFETMLTLQEKMRDRIAETIFYTEAGCYDRSIFDQYCYSNRYIGECLSSMHAEKLQGGDYFHLLKRALAHLKWSRMLLKREYREVDIYFYCQNLKEYNEKHKVVDEVKSEKKRWGDLTLQWIYDTMRISLLPVGKTIVVPAGDLETRVAYCMALIDKRMEK